MNLFQFNISSTGHLYRSGETDVKAKWFFFFFYYLKWNFGYNEANDVHCFIKMKNIKQSRLKRLLLLFIIKVQQLPKETV